MAAEGTWLTLGAAAVATGSRPERIRSLARRGTIQRKRGNGRDWLYQITPELVAARSGTMADLRAGTDDAARWQAVAAELEAEIGELRIGLVRAEERAAAGERIAAAELAAKEAVLIELRALLADARQPWWRRWL